MLNLYSKFCDAVAFLAACHGTSKSIKSFFCAKKVPTNMDSRYVKLGMLYFLSSHEVPWLTSLFPIWWRKWFHRTHSTRSWNVLFEMELDVATANAGFARSGFFCIVNQKPASITWRLLNLSHPSCQESSQSRSPNVCPSKRLLVFHSISCCGALVFSSSPVNVGPASGGNVR